MAVFLRALGQSSVKPRSIRTLPHASDEALEILSRGGFCSYVASPLGVAELAIQAARATIDASGLATEALEAVVLATESFVEKEPADSDSRSHTTVRNDLVKGLIGGLSLSRATLYANWMSGCGNLAPTLGLARSLGLSGESQNTLVIAADRVADDQFRVASNNSMVFSDVACACLISTEGPGLRLLKSVIHYSPALLQARIDRDPLRRVKELRSGILSLDQAVTKTVGYALRDFDLIVIDSFAEPLLDRFCLTTGADRERVVCPARQHYGHAFSADLLLSLKILADTGRLTGTACIAAVSISSWALSAVIFEGS